MQNGKTLYSNVTGPDNDKLMSNKPGVSVMPGMSREAIDQALGGQSAGTVSADNAIRAANLRDGVDMERGTSAEVAGRGAKETLRLASAPLGTPGRAFAQKQLISQEEQKTLRRGQDVTERDNIRTNNTSLTNSAATNKLGVFNADREQKNSDRTFGAGREDAEFTRRETAEKNLHNEIAGMLPPGVDGKPDLANAARYATALNADLSARLSGLERDAKAGKPGAAAALADYNKNGHASLGEGYKSKFIAGMAAKDAIDQGATSRFNPIGGTTTIGNAPVAKLRKTSNGLFGFGGEYEARDAAGNVVGTAPARNIEGDGSFFGGKRRNDLRTLQN